MDYIETIVTSRGCSLGDLFEASCFTDKEVLNWFVYVGTWLLITWDVIFGLLDLRDKHWISIQCLQYHLSCVVYGITITLAGISKGHTLTQGGLNKMDDIVHTTFSDVLCHEEGFFFVFFVFFCYQSHSKTHKIYVSVNWVSMGLNNGLANVQQKAYTGTNDGPINWCTYASQNFRG